MPQLLMSILCYLNMAYLVLFVQVFSSLFLFFFLVSFTTKLSWWDYNDSWFYVFTLKHHMDMNSL